MNTNIVSFNIIPTLALFLCMLVTAPAFLTTVNVLFWIFTSLMLISAALSNKTLQDQALNILKRPNGGNLYDLLMQKMSIIGVINTVCMVVLTWYWLAALYFFTLIVIFGSLARARKGKLVKSNIINLK